MKKKQLSQLEKLSIEKTLKMKLDNETQSFKVWPKPFKKLFTLSGSSLQINLKFQNIQVKISFMIDMRVFKFKMI